MLAPMKGNARMTTAGEEGRWRVDAPASTCDRVLSPGVVFDEHALARSLRVSFRRGVASCDHERVPRENGLTFRGRVLSLPASVAVAEAASILLRATVTEDELAAAAIAAEGDGGLTALRDALATWDRLGLLVRVVTSDVGPVASLEQMVPGCGGCLDVPLDEHPVRLSRFAYCRRQDDVTLLESPLSTARMVLHMPCAAGALVLLAGGAGHRNVAALMAQADVGQPQETAQALLGLLILAGLAEQPATDDGRLSEDDGHRALWEFHDLLFHARSRLGPHDYPVGGTFRMRDSVPALPALPPRRDGCGVDLPRVDRAEPLTIEDSLPDVLERRRSVRRHGREPVSLHQLGEFLDRTARVRRVIARDEANGIAYEATERPYPSGGSTYDLELYVVASRCAGLRPGVYHYEADRHRLVTVSPPSRLSDAVLGEARTAAGMTDSPQILIVVTSRFARVSWKYQAIAYALTLKAVGALYQTMYLTATAMGLAPCAIGTGDAAVMARILDTDYVTESSVGEFLLGSSPANTYETA
jgi:SagB-type dehydrogenase family enzyme